ncbi:MAG: hypothetical protein AB7P04_08845 [Bacteriovoracia bacterium]
MKTVNWILILSALTLSASAARADHRYDKWKGVAEDIVLVTNNMLQGVKNGIEPGKMCYYTGQLHDRLKALWWQAEYARDAEEIFVLSKLVGAKFPADSMPGYMAASVREQRKALWDLLLEQENAVALNREVYKQVAGQRKLEEQSKAVSDLADKVAKTTCVVGPDAADKEPALTVLLEVTQKNSEFYQAIKAASKTKL